MENQRKIAKALGNPENSGISGQFVIQYDIDMNTEGGEVKYSFLIPYFNLVQSSYNHYTRCFITKAIFFYILTDRASNC